MTGLVFSGWGNLGLHQPQQVIRLKSRCSQVDLPGEISRLAFGNGRSYGDEAYNADGALILTKALNRFIFFDRQNGIISLEAGVLLKDILALIVSSGWFLAVTPGTQLISVGGAIANDVHGKNHHVAGSFGVFVSEFELVRSDGSRHLCSRETNSELFYATIGGLGLTGWISWATLRLTKIYSPLIISRQYRFANLKGYMDLNQQLEGQSPYTVAWVDCSRSGAKLGRGIYFCGAHATYTTAKLKPSPATRSIPIQPPFSCINHTSLKLFNSVYFHLHADGVEQFQHYQKFFYPLDQILHWNRLYGHKGFYQYQCVIPNSVAADAIAEMLQLISRSGQGSFLAVLKTFGCISSGGLLSFPRPGVTLAIDFANRGVFTANLFAGLDQIVSTAGGALYPAKDARMSTEMFRLSFPRLNEFLPYKDPLFSSNLWRRVNP